MNPHEPSAVELPVLPRVPPPAPADHPLRDRVLTIVFVVAITLPLIGAFIDDDRASVAFEKRSAAPWPHLPAAQHAKFATAFEAAFDDRFGARDLLIHLHHVALTVGLHVSPVAKVLLGRDDWLYFRGEDTHAIERDFRGTFWYPPQQPAQIAHELERRRLFLAARGIPYFVLIVPDKSTMYPEHLPRWIVRAPKTRLDRLYDALGAYPDLAVIDPRGALRERKRTTQVYYRTDSHWNYEGAIVAYDLLVQRIQQAVPSVPHVPAERPPYEPGDKYVGDLAQLLGLPDRFVEDDLFPLGKILADGSRRCARHIEDPIEPVVEGCARPDLLRAVVYRDSMLDAMMPPLSENFQRVVYFAGHRMRADDIAREHPHLVIEEFVERAMHSLLVDPVQ